MGKITRCFLSLQHLDKVRDIINVQDNRSLSDIKVIEEKHLIKEENYMVKVSIVIPIHNGEQHLRLCIESVIGQTLKEIEIICVDDGSTDMTLAMLRYYQNIDPRVNIIHRDAPEGTMVARKLGTMEAHGEYIMYLDADDYLELGACELLYQKIDREKVDILQFNTNVINYGNLPEQEIRGIESMLTPRYARINGSNILESMVIQKEFFPTMWNKIYRTEICQKACAELPNRFQVMAEDICSVFFIAYYAKSYLGWNSPALYNYFIGRGITGNSQVSFEKFRNICGQHNVVEDLTQFCEKHGIIKKYRSSLTALSNQFLYNCINDWLNRLPGEYGIQGMQILIDHWGVEDILSVLYSHYGNQRTRIASKFSGLPRLSLAEKKVKTVAFFYHTLGIGGLERVIATLAPMLDQMGYRVLMIIESEPTKFDYPLPDSITRVSIQSWQCASEKDFRKRLADWKRLVETYEIDVVLHNAWVCPMLLWDMLYLRTLNVPVIVHCHSVFSFSATLANDLMLESRYVLALSDGLVVLSPADQAYYSAFHSNVYYIPDPISDNFNHATLTEGQEPSIVWVGRNSMEKQPEFVFPIMQYVTSQLPEAKLYMVGAFTEERWQHMAEEYGVKDNIVFCGATLNVGQYYEKASVLLSTSQYEGFSMVLLEAQAHGLPSVIFEMPNLIFAKHNRGVTSVEMNDCLSAAHEIVKLLTDHEYWQHQSNQAQWSFQDLQGYDIARDWQDLLSGKNKRVDVPESVSDLCKVFLENYYQGLRYTDKRINEIYGSMSLASPTLAVEHKGSYKIGCFITYIPRKIWGGIRCMRENGFSYTVRLFFRKVKNKFGKVFLGWDV